MFNQKERERPVYGAADARVFGQGEPMFPESEFLGRGLIVTPEVELDLSALGDKRLAGILVG